MFKLKPECLYAKWDGISDFCGGTTTGLQKSRIYKFLVGSIQDHSTYVKVLDMETRQILPYKYNMVLFTALNKYSGSVSTRPVVGQCSRIIFEEKNLKHYCHTSPILYINAISKNVYDIITNDSVYTVTVIWQNPAAWNTSCWIFYFIILKIVQNLLYLKKLQFKMPKTFEMLLFLFFKAKSGIIILLGRFVQHG